MIRGAAHKTGRRTLHSLWIILASTVFVLTTPIASAQQLRTASLTPGDSVLREADLPKVLSTDDAARYRHIFALQQAERWQDADREIAGLKDKLLLGEVLAQRYRAPSYPATYAELLGWPHHCVDEPDAKAVYALEVTPPPAGAAEPPQPSISAVNIDFDDDN